MRCEHGLRPRRTADRTRHGPGIAEHHAQRAISLGEPRADRRLALAEHLTMGFVHDAAAKDRTSGTDVREPRELGVSGGIFDLADAIEELRKEPAWVQGDRNAVTLVHEGSLRVVLAALKPGARIGNEDTDGRLTLHVLSGEVRVLAETDDVAVGPGRLISLQRDTGWAVESLAESYLLLTISFTAAGRPDPR